MATFSASRTAATPRTAASLTDSSSLEDALNLHSNGFFEVDYQAEFVFSGSPSGNVTVEVFLSADGTNYDTEPALTRTIPFSGAGTKRVTIPGVRGHAANVKASNATGATATYTLRYSGLEQVSA